MPSAKPIVPIPSLRIDLRKRRSIRGKFSDGATSAKYQFDNQWSQVVLDQRHQSERISSSETTSDGRPDVGRARSGLALGYEVRASFKLG